jgi:putative glutamine amidotransferase
VRPVIGIPLWKAPPGESFLHYERSVLRAGGQPQRLTPEEGLGGVHGLLLTGGVDVDPALYGERRHPLTQRPHRGRDEHEMALLREALARRLPLLAICRGHQLLNVALGGRLLQHIEDGSHQAGEDGASAWHRLRLLPGGLLQELYGREELWANSRHHQAVTPDRLGTGLRVLALSPEGIVEAVQVEGHPWAVGVQWHPERPEMWGDGRHPDGPIVAAAPLFAAFIAACRRHG